MPVVKLFASLRELAKVDEIKINECGRIEEVLRSIVNRFPELKNELFDTNGKLRDHLLILINGRNIKLLGEDYKINGNDVIFVFPPSGGG